MFFLNQPSKSFLLLNNNFKDEIILHFVTKALPRRFFEHLSTLVKTHYYSEVNISAYI